MNDRTADQIKALEQKLYSLREELESCQAQEHRVRELVENLNEGLWRIDKEGMTTYANPRMADMLGYTVDNMMGMHVFEFMDEKGREAAAQKMEHRRAGIGEEHDFEFVRKDGSRFTAHLNTSPVYDESGQYVGAVAGVLDITDQVRAERALRESEVRYRTIAENLPNGAVYLFDRDLRFLLADGEALERIGYSKASLENKTVWELGDEAATLLDPRYRRVLAGESLTEEAWYRGRCFLSHYVPFRNEADQVVGGMVVASDITERKRSEEALQASQALFEAVIEQMPAGVVIAEAPLGRIVTSNREAEAILGHPMRPAENIAGYGQYGALRADGTLFRPEEHPLSKALLKGEAVEEEMRYRRGDGSIIWVFATAAPIRDLQGEILAAVVTFQDVSERKRAEQALRASEERLRLITDGLPVLIAYVDAEERYQFNNAAYEQWFGLAPEEVQGKPVKEVLGTTAYNAIKPYLVKALAGEVVRFDSVVPFRFGGTREIEAAYVPHTDTEGKVVGFYALVQDISELSEHKRAEEALRTSEERLALSQKVAGIGSFDWLVAEGRVVWTEGLERLYGLEPGEYQGTYEDWFNRVYPDDQEPTERSVNQAIRQRQEWRVEFRIVRKSGAVRWIYALGQPMFDEAGLLIRFIGINLDITERKQAEEALQRREQAFRAIIEAWPDIVARYDRAFRHLYVSPSIEPVTGLSPDEYIGKTNRDLGMPEDNVRVWETYAGRVLSTGEPQETEFTFTGPDGKSYDYEWRLVPEFGPGGEVQTVLAWARDVTARNRAETAQREAYAELEHTLEELRAAQNQLVRSEKLAALGTLAAGVAHELNNPLMGVLNYVGFARRHVTDPEIQLPLEEANRELKRMRELLKNMLTFARPSTGPITAVDLTAVLARTIELLAPEFRSLQIEFSQEVPETLPAVSGREGPLQQVMLNLLLNARDAVELSPEKRVAVRAYATEADVAVEVQDSGEGIPEAIRERIFDPFFTTKPPGKGTGLGLSMAQSVVSELGGRIEMSSPPRQGAIFTVKLSKAGPPVNGSRGKEAGS